MMQLDEGRTLLKHVFALALVALIACVDSTGIACTEIAIAGLRVDVVDALDGRVIRDATVIAIDGSYIEELRVLSERETKHIGAWERRGLYTIAATAPGYLPGVRSDVRVTGDECHVRTVDVTVRLERSP